MSDQEDDTPRFDEDGPPQGGEHYGEAPLGEHDGEDDDDVPTGQAEPNDDPLSLGPEG